MIDWTFALLFRPDIVKISLDSETALLLREVVATDLGLHERRNGPSALPLAGTLEGKLVEQHT